MRVDKPRSIFEIRDLAVRDRYRMGPGVVAVGLCVLTIALLRLEHWAVDENLLLRLELLAFFGIGIVGFFALLGAQVFWYGYWEGMLPGSVRQAVGWIGVWVCAWALMTATLIYESGPYVQMANVVVVAVLSWALRYEKRTGRPWPQLWALMSLVMAAWIMQFESTAQLWQPLADVLLVALGASMTLFGLLEEVLIRRARGLRFWRTNEKG